MNCLDYCERNRQQWSFVIFGRNETGFCPSMATSSGRDENWYRPGIYGGKCEDFRCICYCEETHTCVNKTAHSGFDIVTLKPGWMWRGEGHRGTRKAVNFNPPATTPAPTWHTKQDSCHNYWKYATGCYFAIKYCANLFIYYRLEQLLYTFESNEFVAGIRNTFYWITHCINLVLLVFVLAQPYKYPVLFFMGLCEPHPYQATTIMTFWFLFDLGWMIVVAILYILVIYAGSRGSTEMAINYARAAGLQLTVAMLVCIIDLHVCSELRKAPHGGRWAGREPGGATATEVGLSFKDYANLLEFDVTVMVNLLMFMKKHWADLICPWWNLENRRYSLSDSMDLRPRMDIVGTLFPTIQEGKPVAVQVRIKKTHTRQRMTQDEMRRAKDTKKEEKKDRTHLGKI